MKTMVNCYKILFFLRITVSTKILNSRTFSTLIIIIVSWPSNQRIRMISEGSCDTEDWSNDAENPALRHRNNINYILKHNQI